ncbi:ABC-three component system protein [Pseudoalteromonas ruthenica]|uniref:ABC-three component systems C-terminal domain-containing protein n=1 Tax=Pseudoalteromonas ruthenica TaxID=151081 RepID=A0A0F4PQX9_9GAMM|nr:ABC-three component system protein [Pseudoalteromonas ruthenica]KJY96671.1 hypothetical protein TW76_11460 [Pseudoalteromonas ruthenica]KJY98542.1 hypothetical protein TW72_12475 [Pseudoalteromonas ruthenica]TMO91264.1 hypothetical protein CWC13_15640 [Pseudoalteromonas ruthenica]TMO97951.1 hypothetical protein CWC07_12830 [Pseudoalteromonas ruthenica]TMP06844.1 hypothetical protein CWC09_10765 [Pseudoalteromonas ruthenica]
MLKKLKLKKADAYDYQVATYYATEALVSYLNRGRHCKRFGHEQGDIDEWDDIVLHELNGKTVHCQIKRQMTDFSEHKTTRGKKTRGKNKGQPQELSALDKAFESLAKHFNNPSVTDEKLFWLSLPYPSINIKEKFTVVDLKDVCDEWKKAGATLPAFTKADGKAKKVKDWLKSWCGFLNDEAIYKCIRSLEVQNTLDENELKKASKDKLAHWYTDTTQVLDNIKEFLTLNASSELSVTPRMIAHNIRHFLKPQCRTWARYEKRNKLNWLIAGTLSGHSEDIEPPSLVVENLWNKSNDRNFELCVKHPSNIDTLCSLDLSLVRLALHTSNGVSIVHNNPSAWKKDIAHAIRLTLGTTPTDFSNTTIVNDYEEQSPIDHRYLSKSSEVKSEQIQLTKKMDNLTWEKTKDQVDDYIIELESGEVQNTAEAIWTKWKNDIDADPSLQASSLSDMMYAIVEGNKDIGQLRAGPMTVHLLSEAFGLLLFLAIGLDAEKKGWREFCSEYSVRTIALAYWSGSQVTPSKPRKFFEADKRAERAELLGKETSNILVLPQTTASSSTVLGHTLASSESDGDRIADTRSPKSVITKSFEFIDVIESNSIENIKNFVQDITTKKQSLRDQHIKSLTTG